MSHDHHPNNRSNPWNAMGGALFLACSWTWVVGMVLPVYLVRDFDVVGWVAFAIPNVIGAASVGFVFAKRERLDCFVAEHRTALLWFSFVTVLFHLSVVARLGVQVAAVRSPGLGAWQLVGGGVVLAAVLGVAGLLLARLPRGWGVVGGACYLASLVLFAVAGAEGMLGVPEVESVHEPWMVIGAVPALAFGFLLCPQMDLTLLRVRREVGGDAGKAAFVVGFGVLFLAMIVGTLLYAGVHTLPLLLYAHICVQSVFTMGVHLRELRARVRPSWWAVGLCAVVVAGSAMLPLAGAYRGGYAVSRLAYEVFISAYGLVFPAYLWIVALWGFAPDAGGVSRSARLKTWVGALAITGPMFWSGYVEQFYGWLVVGVGLVLVAPWVAGQFVSRPSL